MSSTSQESHSPGELRFSDVQLKPDHQAELGRVHSGIRASLDTVVTQLGTKHGQEDLAPGAEEFLAILRSPTVKRVVHERGQVYILSDEGIQHYEIDKARKELVLVSPDVSSDATVQKLFQTVAPFSSASSEELSVALSKALQRSKQHKDLSRPIPLSAKFTKDTGVTLETLRLGTADKADDRLRTGAPARQEFFTAPEGHAIRSLSISSQENPAGVLADIKVQTIRPGSESDATTEQHEIQAFFSPRGEILYKEPASEGQKRFRKYSLPQGLECMNLGNKILIRKLGGQPEIINVPSIDNKVVPYLGEVKETHTVGKTTYVNFEAIPSGNITFAIDSATGTLNTSKGMDGIIKGDGVFFDQGTDRIFVLQSNPGKNERKIDVISVQEIVKVRKIQALSEVQARQLAGVIGQTRGKFEIALGTDTLDPFLGDVEGFLRSIRPFTVDPDVRAFSDALGRSAGELKSVQTRALREETVRRSQTKRLGDLEEHFKAKIDPRFQIEGFDPDKELRIGGMMDILRSYQVLRAGFSAELNNTNTISQLSPERLGASHRLLEEHDKKVHVVREALGKRIGKEIPSQKQEGLQHLSALAGASGEGGYLAVAAAKHGLDQLVKFIMLVKELQKTPEHFFSGTFTSSGFTLDEAGESAKRLVDRETVRGSELTADDLQDEARGSLFRLAHIERLYPELYAQAVRKNIDPVLAGQFFEAVQIIIDQAGRLMESADMSDIDDSAARLERDLQALEDGVYKNASLEHSHSHRALLFRAKSELAIKTAEARSHLLKQTSREKKTLSDLIEEKARKVCRAIDIASRIQEADRSLSSEDQSRAIWARVQMYVRGFDIAGQQKRPGLPEHAYSEQLQDLFGVVERFEQRFQDREEANAVWRELDKALQKATNRIEADKGYSKKPGHYVLDLPECYQLRIPERIAPVEIPLSGKDEIQPLELETNVEEIITEDGRRLGLVMTTVGNEKFKKELPIGQRFLGALPALDWQSPRSGSAFSADYQGPEVRRPFVALTLLLERLPRSPDGISLIQRFPVIMKTCGDDLAKFEQTLLQNLRPQLRDLQAEFGISLTSEDHQALSKALVSLLKNDQLKYVDHEDPYANAPRVPEITPSEHDEVIGQITAAWEFRGLFEEPLKILHAAIRRNEQRVRQQMGLSQQEHPEGKPEKNPTRLPHDYRETGLNVVQMRRYITGLQTCKDSADKQATLAIGDFGGGKTTAVLAVAAHAHRRLHMINGNILGEVGSLDPFAAARDKEGKFDPTLLDSTVVAQLSLLCATMTQMKNVVALLDEGQFLSADFLNSLLNVLDARAQLSTSVGMHATENAEDINVFDATNTTDKSNTLVISANRSYTIPNKSTGERMTVDFILPEALIRRIELVDMDDIEQQHEFLWIASYIERGSADLGIHPDDVKYLISRRLLFGDFDQPIDVAPNDPNLKDSSFVLDPQRLEEIIKAIDYRCIAAKILVEIQKASRRTRQTGGDVSKLGTPPCWMTAVGGGNVKTLMPLLTHQVKDETQVRAIIREHLMGNTGDRGPSHKEDNILFLEHVTGDWRQKTEADWKREVANAERMRIEGLSPNPVVGPLRSIADMLQQVRFVLDSATQQGGKAQGEIVDAVAMIVEALKASGGQQGDMNGQVKELLAGLTGLSGQLKTQAAVQPVSPVPSALSAAPSAPSAAPSITPATPSGISEDTLRQLSQVLVGILNFFQSLDAASKRVSARSGGRSSTAPLTVQ